jgi:sulfate adenylyltransferase
MSEQKSQGFTTFFTGLSGSGKSTTSELVDTRLQEILHRPVTVLDGDEVRQHLSAGLGFTKEGRDANIRRIGYVASLVTKHGGIAICAPIAPYRETRREVREMVEQYGSFIEVYMATSLEECERRDVKGLYAKARAGEIEHFTGVSDPYEQPEQPELRINTEGLAPEQSCELVIQVLEKLGHL